VSTVKEKSAQGKTRAAEKGLFGSFVQNLLRAAVYKRNQGRITRQVTFTAIAVTIGLGAWSLSDMANPNNMTMLFAIPGLVACAGFWTAYRIVNWPMFADFLISVEAEMSKVSWPTRTELIRGSVVVLITIASLAIFLYSFDLLWTFIFQRLGVLS
jgi:preprotein translocase subunit SecE